MRRTIRALFALALILSLPVGVAAGEPTAAPLLDLGELEATPPSQPLLPERVDEDTAETSEALSGAVAETVVSLNVSPSPLIEIDPEARYELSHLDTVVIDPGHGGTNEGALGVANIHEKHITLPIALHLADALRAEHPDLNVILTRESDVDVSLSERIAIANAAGADLFISIHLNSAGNPEAHGVETWSLMNTAPVRDDDQGLFAAVLGSREAYSHTLSHRETCAGLSREFAGALHGAYAENLGEIRDRGLKQGNYTVLRRAEVPAVVVELGFLSHADEGMAVVGPKVQTALVEALVQGVERFDAQRDAGGSDPRSLVAAK